MNSNKTINEREQGGDKEVRTAEEASATEEKPACGCCGGKGQKQ